MPIFSFSCGGCGWSDDRRVGWGIRSISCPSCGCSVDKSEVYRIAFTGFASTPLNQRTYYQEFKDFKEASSELEYKHGRMEEAVGRELAPPPLAQMGVAKAKELQAKGVKSSEDWMQREKH